MIPNSSRALILGGTGALSRALISYCAPRFAEVVVGNRAGSISWFERRPRVSVVHIDRSEESSVNRLASIGPIDICFDLSNFHPAHTRRLLASGNIARVVLISTVNVYSPNCVGPVDEASDTVPIPRNIGSAELSSETYAPLKLASENFLRDNHDNWLILRLGSFFGWGDKVSQVHSLQKIDFKLRHSCLRVSGTGEEAYQTIEATDIVRLFFDRIHLLCNEVVNVVGPEINGKGLLWAVLIRTCYEFVEDQCSDLVPEWVSLTQDAPWLYAIKTTKLSINKCDFLYTNLFFQRRRWLYGT